MSTDNSRHLKLTAAWFVLATTGLVAGVWGYRTRDADMRARLLGDARRSLVAIDAAELSRLTGSRADMTAPTYAEVKDRLRRLRAVNPDVQFVSLFRFDP